ncbi:phage tail protein I [Bradyrhizobium ottawaense]|uniref:Phage tail protein, P2 protein I family n=1 Tax=Bradyrhizobium ottawaense TaxID=931866 RepID=A0ABY0QH40_9BRAD|nr:phage tail protein I [Bradyrhizobium ottawaense]SDK40250.1 phage tail protein, P2 protein I family [Bradyrhizobium ottawaense]
MADRLMEHILAPNATVYERTLASQVDRLLDLDIDRLRRLWDPYRCHIDDLPYLAWSFSVDIWDPHWTEAKKRQVVANAVAHHRIKGTKAGMAAYLDLVGSNLRDLIVPPARGYRIPAMTNESFMSWLLHLPQIRVYPYVIRDPAGPRDFRVPVVCFRNDNFREKSLGPNLYGRKASIYKNGVEAYVKLESMTELGGQAVERVFIGNNSERDYHTDGFRGHKFYKLTDATDNIITVRINANGSDLVSLTPGLTPQDVKPVQIAERHVPQAGQHFHDYNKSFRGGNFRRETDAARWVYDRLALHDKKDLPAGLSTKSYRGHMRYGIPAYTAQAKVEVPLIRSPALGFGGRFRNGFRIPTDMEKLNDACGAIVAAKPLRDTVLVDTVNYRVVRLGEARKLGTFKLGEIKKVA